MNKLALFLLCIVIPLLVFLSPFHSATAAGLLTPTDGSRPALKIREHHVNIIVEDGYAITTVDQVFHNPSQQDLEAIYSFPVPEKGTVSQFTMWIDGKPIHGEVLEKQKARDVYEQQKSSGNDSGLAEKDKYKTFEISVFPVRAGKDTKIRIAYIQPVHVDSGVGRYIYPLEEGGVDEQKLSFWTAEEEISHNFSFNLRLRPSYPVDKVLLPKHPQARIFKQGNDWLVRIGNNPIQGLQQQQKPEPMRPDQQLQMQSPQAIKAKLAGQPQQGEERLPAPSGTNQSVYTLNQDIVVYYRHAPNLPGSVDLVAYKPDRNKWGTFMLTVTPGMDLKPITEGRDWVFVLDISGSMQGKYQTLAEGVSRALTRMTPRERFRIILFNNSSRELTSGFTPATPENVNHAIGQVKAITPGKGTNLYAGLKDGLSGINRDRTSSIILVTDGVANVGETAQRKFIDLLGKKDIRLFTFIMGNSANRPLLDSLTEVSNGFAVNISNSDEIIGQILLAKSKVAHEALHGAKLKISGVKVTDITPDSIRSLYRGQQLIIFGHYFKGGEAGVILSGKISGQKKVYSTKLMFPDKTAANPEIERLWAYAVIERTMREIDNYGEKADLKQAVTDLGVEYGLVTDYPSMLIVRDQVFKQLGINRKNKKQLEREFAAQKQRANRTAPRSNRVDQSAPMFKNNRPSTRGSGSGAIDGWMIGLMAPALLVAVYRRSKKGK